MRWVVPIKMRLQRRAWIATKRTLLLVKGPAPPCHCNFLIWFCMSAQPNYYIGYEPTFGVVVPNKLNTQTKT